MSHHRHLNLRRRLTSHRLAVSPVRLKPGVLRTGSLILAGTIAVFSYLNAQRLNQELSRPLGHMTRQQVLDRSEPICRAIAPQVDMQYFSLDSSSGSSGKFWIVTCRDRSNRELAMLTWNADTVELYAVGCWSPNQKGGTIDTRPLLRADAAIRRTYYWLSALGIVQTGSAWHARNASVSPLNSPGASAHSWVVKWAGEGRQAVVVIEAHSGDLLDFTAWHNAPLTRSDRNVRH